MSIIDFETQTANFEAIRDRIAMILADELANQASLSGNTLFNAGVWLERSIPLDKSELPAINVIYLNSDAQQNTPETSIYESEYLIDIKVNAKHTDIEKGDVLAAKNCQKLTNAVRTILEFPGYLTLGFDPGFVARTTVEGFRIGNTTEGDGLHTITAQINFKVVHNEGNGQLTGVAFDDVYSEIDIEGTDNGIIVKIKEN